MENGGRKTPSNDHSLVITRSHSDSTVVSNTSTPSKTESVITLQQHSQSILVEPTTPLLQRLDLHEII